MTMAGLLTSPRGRPRRAFMGLLLFSLGVLGVLFVTEHRIPSRDMLLPSNMVFWRSSELDRNYSRLADRLNSACAELRYIGKVNYSSKRTRQVFASKKYKFSVCVVPKSGCTFMKQLVYYLNDPRDWDRSQFSDRFGSDEAYIQMAERAQKRIFDMPRMDVHHDIHYDPLEITLKEFATSDGLKVVHARNPYSRLYSAYVDKFYIPARWKLQTATYRLKLLQRRQALARTARISAMSQDVYNPCNAKSETFEEFLESVLLMSEFSAFDAHWGPVSYLCDPCRTKPDIVVRQENYHDDVQYLLGKLNINYDQLETINKAIAKQGVQTDVYLHGLIKTMYIKGMEGSEGKCFTKVEMAYRVWKSLKIQGQLYQSIEFPYSKFYNNPSFDANFVAKVFLSEMRGMPITAEESRLQRNRALARAYRNIRPEILIQIQGMYYHDFKMFGYDINPPKVQS